MMKYIAVIFAIVTVCQAAPAGKSIVAFSAGLSHTQHVISGEKIAFDKIFTNVGGGYDMNTGVFTAPKNGIYAFHIHAYAMNNDKTMWIELKKNDQFLVSLSGYNSHSSAGNSDVIYLSSGDRVYVQARPGQDFSLFGKSDQIYATFTGYMIGEMSQTHDDSDGGIVFPGFPQFPATGK